MRLGKVSDGNGGLDNKKFSFLNPVEASYSMFISAVLCSVTGSSSSSFLGGISIRASLAALIFFMLYSIAAFKLKASIRAVSFNVYVLPTVFTSTPSELLPTPSSGCSLTPFSIMSAMCFREGASCFIL